MNKLDNVYEKNISVEEYTTRYTEYLSKLLTKLDLAEINDVVSVFQKARSNGNTIFFIGNGGSAATCSHFMEDLVGGTTVDGTKPFKAASLVDNSSFITALGNDEGYDSIFEFQLRSILNGGDVVVAISGSGNSPNLLKAVEYANANGGITVGITGFDGGKLKTMCAHCIHVRAIKGEYALVEDIHLILGHIISTYLMYKIREE